VLSTDRSTGFSASQWILDGWRSPFALVKETMSEIHLPKSIQAIVAAVNDADMATFIVWFGVHGIVDDWGDRYVGHDEIRAWCKREVIGVKQTWKVTRVEGLDDQVSVMIDVGGGGFNGASRFRFTLKKELVEEMKITAD
jgi:hypothetical protein